MQTPASTYAYSNGHDDSMSSKESGLQLHSSGSEMYPTRHAGAREQRVIDRIRSVFEVHHRLCEYAASLQVSIENTVIVLRGDLPSADLKQELVPAVRQAGVLGKVSNNVEVLS